jgi:hypothetical protein
LIGTKVWEESAASIFSKVEATGSCRVFVPVYSHAVSHSRRWKLNRLRLFENIVEESVTN